MSLSASSASDQILVEQAKSDPETFGILFDRHFDPSFAYLFRRTGDWEASRDLASETFLKALTRLPLKYQEAIALRYFEEKSVVEVAEILGMLVAHIISERAHHLP